MMTPMIKINYDEIGVKTASKCIARMTGCWFESSSESYRRDHGLSMIYGDSLSSISLAIWGGWISYSVEHMAGEVHVWINWLKPRAPIYVYTENAQSVDVSKVDNGGVQ